MSPYLISGELRRQKKKELSHLKSYVKDFWRYEDVDRVYGGGLDDQTCQKLISEAKKEIKQLWPVENETWYGHDIINWGGRGIDQTNSIEYKEEDQIEVINLDSLNISECSLYKLDIQGYEYFALLGSKNLIEKCKPIILLENSPENDLNALEFLKDLGYENYRYYSNNNEDCILIHPNSNKYNISIETINLLKNKYDLKQDF